MATLFVQAQNFTLAGSGVAATATSVILSSFADIDGNLLTMANFGAIGYMTMEPNNGIQEESISFSGVTQNANGSATLTGIMSVAFKSPYTSTSGFLKAHAGGTICILTNTAGYYNNFANKLNNETVTGAWTFSQVTTGVTPTLPAHLVTKAYADGLVGGGVADATLLVAGKVQLATQAEVDAKTVLGTTGASLMATLDRSRSTLLSDYVADTGLANAYVITPIPAITAYTTGQIFSFKATNANSGASTLNVSGLGVKTIFKQNGATNLISNDIQVGQLVTVMYDGTNFQMLSQTGNAPGTTNLFGGTGADGAFSVVAGTTVIDFGGARELIKNYTSFALTGTGKITFINPHDAGSTFHIRTTGNCTITSTTNPAIDLRLMGGAGGGNPDPKYGRGVGGGQYSSGNGDTTGGSGANNAGYLSATALYANAGGGGSSGSGSGSPNGGRGGGGLVIECKGSFTNSAIIESTGGGGSTGSSTSGGGGAGGQVLVIANTIVSDTGTYTLTGGATGLGIGGTVGVDGQSLRVVNSFFV